MKHTMGNSPKCIECYWYRDKQDGDHCRSDGWCVNEYKRTHDIAGKKRSEPKDMAVAWNTSCHQWEDAEDRLTAYEVQTRQPEPWRTPIEQMQIRALLRNESAEHI